MSTSFSVPRDTIISTALRKLQVIELGTTPDTNTLSNAAQSLNIMIKAWQSQGIKLWTIQEYPIPMVAGQNAYTIGNSTTPTTNALVGPTSQPVGGVSAVTMTNNGSSGGLTFGWNINILPSNIYTSVIWNGSIFCAVGQGTIGATSSDGITWTQRVLPTPPNGTWYTLAWNGSVFCTTSNTNSATSPDGITWTLHAGVIPNNSSYNLTYGNGVFVAGTAGFGIVNTSPDGIVWTSHTAFNLGVPTSVVWTGAQFVMVGNSGNALTSPDGMTWTPITVPSASGYTAIAWNGTTLCAVLSNSTIAATSTDGITWVAQTLPSSSTWKSIAWNGTVFCVTSTSSNTIITSPTGVTWSTTVVSGTTVGWSSITSNGNSFCAVPGVASTEAILSYFSYPSSGTYQLTFTGGTGTGAAGTYTISPTTGSITTTTITNAGAGYYGTAPTVSFIYGGITGAAGTVTVSATNTFSPITAYNYTADKPLKVIQAWARNISVTPNIDIPLEKLSRQEYNILGSKFTQGMVNSVWYDPNTTYGTAHLFLTPDTNTATNYFLYLVGQRPLGDVNLSTDIPDFPNEWMQALIWGLADELAIEYGLPINHRQEIAMKAEKYRKEMEDWDVEEASTKFTPDMRMRSR